MVLTALVEAGVLVLAVDADGCGALGGWVREVWAEAAHRDRWFQAAPVILIKVVMMTFAQQHVSDALCTYLPA